MDLGTIFSISLNGGTPVPVKWNFLLGLVFIFFASYFRRLSLSGQSDWKKAHQVVQPSLQASQPPITVTRIGVSGLFSYWTHKSLQYFFIVLAVDQFFTNGAVIFFNLPDVLSSALSAILQFFSYILQLASNLMV